MGGGVSEVYRCKSGKGYSNHAIYGTFNAVPAVRYSLSRLIKCDATTEVCMNEFRGPNGASTSRWVGAEAV